MSDAREMTQQGDNCRSCRCCCCCRRSTPSWGLGTGRCSNRFRFFCFTVLHLANFVANVSIVIYSCPALLAHGTLEEVYCGVVVILAEVLVGLYCTGLAWGDQDIHDLFEAEIGKAGVFLVCFVLGATQLIQVKIAWSTYLQRSRQWGADPENQLEDEEEDEELQEREPSRRQPLVAQPRRLDSPWLFPSKCFEGLLEGTVFSIAVTYAVSRVGWEETPVIEEYIWSNFIWRNVLIFAGQLSFLTLGVSLLNFDHQMSPAVRSTVDSSLVYTGFHFVYRASEAGSRITQIVLWCLVWRDCNATARNLPYLYLLLEYVLCIIGMLIFSAEEEKRHESLSAPGGWAKRFLCACLASPMLLIANLVQFVDDTQVATLTSAASRFSIALRVSRAFDLIALSVILVEPTACLPENVSCMLVFMQQRHPNIMVIFYASTIVYWLMSLFRFHCKAMNHLRNIRYVDTPANAVNVTSHPASGETERAITSRTTDSWRVATNCPTTDALDPVAALVSRAAANSSAQNSSDPPTYRNVSVRDVSEDDLPEPLREFQRRVQLPQTWTHIAGGNSRARRATSLSSLVLSKGVRFPVADKVLTVIDETRAVAGDDFVRPEPPKMSDFEIGVLLGKGSYGTVHKATQLSTGNSVAIKVMLKHHFTSREARAAPRAHRAVPHRERNSLFLAGRHPNIATLEAAFQTESTWIIATELCACPLGGTLLKHIDRYNNRAMRDQRNSRDGMAGIPARGSTGMGVLGRHIINGLAHLHNINILHRDIKPANIGLAGTADEPVAKILDFGLAKHAPMNTAQTLVGSTGYVAPEIAGSLRAFGGSFNPLERAGTCHDHRVDLYSFGILIFVALVGNEARLIDGDGEDSEEHYWTHSEFRGMLESASARLWHCHIYQILKIHGARALEELQACGALETVKNLTATDPYDRPVEAFLAEQQPLFAAEEDSDAITARHSEHTVGTDRPSEPLPPALRSAKQRLTVS